MLNWSVNLNPQRLSPRYDLEELRREGDRALEHISALGVRFVRSDVLWALLEPDEGVFNEGAFAWYRHYFGQLRDRGIGVYAILYNPPAWACAQAHGDPEAFLETWRRYCRRVVDELGDLITLYQVWNEPNNFLSHLKDDFNLFDTRTLSVKGWSLTIPTGVRWKSLIGLFRVAREELGSDALIAFNLVTNIADFLPFSFPDWAEWDHFTEEFLARAGHYVDVVALDHYPETWFFGDGPLNWPLAEIRRKVMDPSSSWHGKTVIVGETGYSSCRNVTLMKVPPIQFFPANHTELTMDAWFRVVMPFLADEMAPERWPQNKLHIVNVYELYDSVPGAILGGNHSDVVGIEYHFGLMRHDRSPKPAFDTYRKAANGELRAEIAERGKTGPLHLYMKTSRASKSIHRWAAPILYALYKAAKPPIRRHDAGVVSIGALWVLYHLWQAGTRPKS